MHELPQKAAIHAREKKFSADQALGFTNGKNKQHRLARAGEGKNGHGGFSLCSMAVIGAASHAVMRGRLGA